MLQIAEDASRLEQIENLSIQRPLALVHEVMDGEARDYRLELAQLRQRIIQIMGDDLHRQISVKSLPDRFQHSWRKIYRHGLTLPVRPPGEFGSDQCQQPTVAGAQIE